MAALDPHPALKAAIEQASPADQFLGDDFHHNGAFRLSYGFEYSAMLETIATENYRFQFDRADTYDWYLGLGAALQRRREVLSRQDAHLDGFHAPSQLRRLLAAAGLRALPERGEDSDHPHAPAGGTRRISTGRRRSTRLLERARHRASQLLRRRPVESRRVERQRQASWAPSISAAIPRCTIARRSSSRGSTTGCAAKGELKLAEATVFETGANQWREYDSWPPQKRRGAAPAVLPRGQPALAFDRPGRAAPSTST